MVDGFVFSIIYDYFGALAEVNLIFAVDKFGQGWFHFRKLFHKCLIVRLDFVDKGLICFDDSCNYSGHEFYHRLKFNSSLVILLQNLVFFGIDFLMELDDFWEKLAVCGDLVVDENGIFDGSLFDGYALIVLK